MTKIINIGMNHETAPVDLRECLADDPDNSQKALSFMREHTYFKEGIFLSTCNRVEALFTTESSKKARTSIISFMSTLGRIPVEKFSSHLYAYEDADAFRHIFRVTSSLDSMVVGEPQILGQIKEAYAEATKQKMSGVILNRLMHRAFHVAKRVRTETDISEAAVSISYAAIELAKKIFHELQGKSVLLIGAGEMAELAAKHLIKQGVTSIAVANRTLGRAVEVANILNAQPISLGEIENKLVDVDIVVTSTASNEYMISYDLVKKSLKKRRNRPLFFIDIAVPRDVQPEVNELGNAYVYDIDDLKGVIEFNVAQRHYASIKAERIIEEEVVKFDRWLKTLSVVPTIVSLQKKAESIIRSEFNKSRTMLDKLTVPQKEAVRTLTRSVVEKVLNEPILFLKKKSNRPSVDTYLDIARKLFNLDNDDGKK